MQRKFLETFLEHHKQNEKSADGKCSFCSYYEKRHGYVAVFMTNGISEPQISLKFSVETASETASE